MQAIQHITVTVYRADGSKRYVAGSSFPENIEAIKEIATKLVEESGVGSRMTVQDKTDYVERLHRFIDDEAVSGRPLFRPVLSAPGLEQAWLDGPGSEG